MANTTKPPKGSLTNKPAFVAFMLVLVLSCVFAYTGWALDRDLRFGAAAMFGFGVAFGITCGAELARHRRD